MLSIPSPALLAQVDEHSLELYVVTPDGIAVTKRVHAAVLVCVKTAAILGAILSLGPLKEEDYMRLVKMALEPKDELVMRAGCQHSWPCYGKPAIVFHDRGKIFTSGGMTLEELERYFYQAIVDDYQQAWDKLRRQKRCVLWEHTVAPRAMQKHDEAEAKIAREQGQEVRARIQGEAGQTQKCRDPRK